MPDLTKKLYKKVEKDLLKKIGADDTSFLLNKFGSGKSFLNTICLLPIWFSDSFSKNETACNLSLLAEANLNAWIGYTLYDYLRDGKIPKEKTVTMISVANIYTNKALSIFIDEADSEQKKLMISNLFEKIDLFYIKQKNSLEFNDFDSFCSIVHEKSIAAAISAILAIPSSEYSKSVKATRNFFKFYFTARQLSDDLDDYKKDIKAKIKTPVTLMVERGLSKKELTLVIRKKIDHNFSKCLNSLKKIEGFDSQLFTDRYVKTC